MAVASVCRPLVAALLMAGVFSLASGTPCPPEWRQSGAWCYLTNTSSSLSWAGASAICEERGGSLVTIHNRSRLLDVTDLLLSLQMPPPPPAPTTTPPPTTSTTEDPASRFGRSLRLHRLRDLHRGLQRQRSRFFDDDFDVMFPPFNRHMSRHPRYREMERLMRRIEQDMASRERAGRANRASRAANAVGSEPRWWIGIRKKNGTTGVEGRGDGIYDNFGEEKIKRNASVTHQCVYMTASDGLWYWTACDTALHYVCQREADRVPVQLVSPERRRPSAAWLRAHEATLLQALPNGRDDLDDDKGQFNARKATMTPITTTTTTTSTTPPATSQAPTTATPSPCSGVDWWMLTSSCHHLYLDAKSYDEAERTCQAKGGHLTQFQDEAAQTTFQRRYHFNSGSIWVGLTLPAGSLSAQWTGGATPSYTAWAPGHPVTGQTCVALDMSTNKWLTADCGEAKPFACFRDVDATERPLVVTTTPAPAADPCGGGGWWQFGSSCLLLVTNTSASWHAAERDCRSRSATQVKITNAELNQRILAKLNGVSAWVGLSRLGRADRSYRWTDGSGLTYTNWDGPVPTAATSWDDDMTSCALLDGSGRWRRVNCNAPRPYVCQRPAGGGAPPAPPPVQPPPRSSCPPAWLPYGPDRCLKAFNGSWSWGDARQWCRDQADGGDLVSVPDAVYQAFLTSAVKESRDNLWISLFYDTLDRQRFLSWTDESAVNFTNWAPGQPSATCASCPKKCGVVDGRKTHTPAAWSDVACTLGFGAVCQRPAAPNNSIVATQRFCENTDSQYIAAGGACYKIAREPKTWHEAADVCQNDNSALAYVENVFDNAELVKLLYREESPQFWLGLSDTRRHGLMEWTQPWPPTSTYVNWDLSYARKPSRDSCAVLLSATGLWQHRDCGLDRRPFVCERAPQREAPEAAAGHCETGWEAGESRCYRVFEPEGVGMNWTQAKADCEQRGFQLATVSSVTDFRAIRTTVGTLSSRISAWVGLRSQQGLDYSWTDGSAPTYRAWQRSEPIRPAACVEASPLIDGRWQTRDCGRQTAYVCMKGMINAGTDALSGKAPGGSSGWASLGIAVIVLALLAAVAVLGVWYARRRRLPWLPAFLQTPRGAHHSVENLAYSRHQNADSSEGAAGSSDLDTIATNRWGSKEQLVLGDN